MTVLLVENGGTAMPLQNLSNHHQQQASSGGLTMTPIKKHFSKAGSQIDTKPLLASTPKSKPKEQNNQKTAQVPSNLLTAEHRHEICRLVALARLSDEFWAYYKQGRGRLTIPPVPQAAKPQQPQRPLSSTHSSGSGFEQVGKMLQDMATLNEFLIFLNALRLYSFFPLASQLEAVVLPDRCIRVSPSGSLRRRGELKLCIGISRIRLPVTDPETGAVSHQWIRCCRFRPSPRHSKSAIEAEPPAKPVSHDEEEQQQQRLAVESPPPDLSDDPMMQPLIEDRKPPIEMLLARAKPATTIAPPSMTLIEGGDDESCSKIKTKKPSFFRSLFSCFCPANPSKKSSKKQRPNSVSNIHSAKAKYLVTDLHKPHNQQIDNHTTASRSNVVQSSSNDFDDVAVATAPQPHSKPTSPPTSPKRNVREPLSVRISANSKDSDAENSPPMFFGRFSKLLEHDRELVQAVHDHFVKACVHDANEQLSEFVETTIGALFFDVSGGDGPADVKSSCYQECCGLEVGSDKGFPSHVTVSICFTATRQLAKLERCLADKTFLGAVKGLVFPYEHRPPSTAHSGGYLSSTLDSNSSSSGAATNSSGPVSPNAPSHSDVASSQGDSCHVSSPEPLPTSSNQNALSPPCLLRLDAADVELFVVVRSTALKSVELDLQPAAAAASSTLLLRNSIGQSSTASEKLQQQTAIETTTSA